VVLIHSTIPRVCVVRTHSLSPHSVSPPLPHSATAGRRTRTRLSARWPSSVARAPVPIATTAAAVDSGNEGGRRKRRRKG